MSAEVLQGDCLELLRSLEPESVQLFCTSPPYAQGKEYETGLDYDGLWNLMAGVAEAALPICKPSGFFFVNFGETTKYPRCMAELYTTVFTEAGWLMHSRRVWLKAAGRVGYGPLQQTRSIPIAEFEHIWTFRKPPNPCEPSRDRLRYRGVWGPFDDAANLSDHPCEFPVSLPAAAIRVWTDPGDLVVDPFCGSGSTGVAAIQEGRDFIGLELDPGYCEMARRRLETTTPPLFVPEAARAAQPPLTGVLI